MKRLFLSAFGTALLALSGVAMASGNPQQAAQSQDKTPPSYDMKAQALLDLDLTRGEFAKQFGDTLEVRRKLGFHLPESSLQELLAERVKSRRDTL